MMDMAIELTSEDLDVLRKALEGWNEDIDGESPDDVDLDKTGWRRTWAIVDDATIHWMRLVHLGVMERSEEADGVYYRISQRGRDILKAEDERQTPSDHFEPTDEDWVVLNSAKHALDIDAGNSRVVEVNMGYYSKSALYRNHKDGYDWERAEAAGWLKSRIVGPEVQYRITQHGLNLLKAHEVVDAQVAVIEADLAASAAKEPAPQMEEIVDLNDLWKADTTGEQYVVDRDGKLTPANPDDYTRGFADGHQMGISETNEEQRQLVKAHFADYSPRAEYDDVADINSALVFAEVTVMIDAERQLRHDAEAMLEKARIEKDRFQGGFSQLAMMFDCLSEMAHEQDEYGNYAGDLRGAVKFASLIAGRLQRDLVDDVRDAGEYTTSQSYNPTIADIPF